MNAPMPSASTSERMPRAPGRRPAVLVVDPDRVSRRSVERALARAACDVETAERADAALEIVQYGAIDVVVSDTVLDDAVGRVFLDRVRALCGPRAPAFVFLCSSGDPAARAAHLRCGAADVIAKPFHPDELCARVEAVLARRVPPDVAGAGLRGHASDVHLTDVLGMLELGRYTGVLHVAAGSTVARVALLHGRIAEASFGTLTGAAAIHVLIERATVSTFRFERQEVQGAHSLSITELLLQSAVLEDTTRDGAPAAAPEPGAEATAADRLARMGVHRTPIELRRPRRVTSPDPRRPARRDVAKRVMGALHDPMLLGDVDLAGAEAVAQRAPAERFLRVELWASLDEGVAALVELMPTAAHHVMVTALRGDARELHLTWDLGGCGLVLRLVDVERPGAARDPRNVPDAVVVAPPAGDVLALHPARLAELGALAGSPHAVTVAALGGRGLTQTVAALFPGQDAALIGGGPAALTGDLRASLVRLVARWSQP